MRPLRALPLLFLPLLLLVAGNAFAQAGANDPSFNPEDLGYLPGTNGSVNAIAVQPDGKIVIGGTFTVCNGITRGHIARMNADGSLDTGFDPGTGANNSVNTIAMQPDGKILIGGAFTNYNGLYHNHLARLNADGSQDLDFDEGIAANGTVNSIHVLSDGAILIAGAFSSYTGMARSRIARLNADGSLDESFDPGTGANNTVNSAQVLDDGNIVIAGTFTSYNATARNRIARLDADGGLDVSFDPGSGANNTILSTAVQSDGKVLIGGTFTSFNGVSRTRIARLTAAGSLDTGFDTGSGANDSLKCMYVQADGKVIIGGSFLDYNGVWNPCITRLNADGSMDTTFIVVGGVVNCITAQADGDLLIGGSFDAFTFEGSEHHNIVRLHADGSEDFSFDLGTGACCSYSSSWGIISGMAVQPNGKILIGGVFGAYNGVSRHGIARLNEDGNLDTSFDPGMGVDTYIRCFDVQADGRILIGGDFTSYNGVPRNRVARLNADGSLDTTFAVGTGADEVVYSITSLADGKVLIGGGFESYNDIYRRSLARLNADGSLDSTFVPSFGILTGILCANEFPDGKILVGGQFHQCGGLQRNGLARLNTDGTLDTDFDPGTGVNGGRVFSIAVRSDAQILIAGDFTHYDGHTRHNIALFGPDGAYDNSVNPGSGTGTEAGPLAIESMLEQPDGKIIIAGHFTSYNGSPANSVARLEADGSLDESFNSGAGTQSGSLLYLRCIALQNDWSLIFAGDFYNYDGAGRNCIARVLLDGTVGVDGSAPSDANSLHLWPNPTDGDQVSITLDGLDRSLRTVDAELYDATGREMLETTLPVNGGSLNTSLDLGHAETGVYLLQLVAGEKTFSQRVVVER